VTGDHWPPLLFWVFIGFSALTAGLGGFLLGQAI